MVVIPLLISSIGSYDTDMVKRKTERISRNPFVDQVYRFALVKAGNKGMAIAVVIPLLIRSIGSTKTTKTTRV